MSNVTLVMIELRKAQKEIERLTAEVSDLKGENAVVRQREELLHNVNDSLRQKVDHLEVALRLAYKDGGCRDDEIDEMTEAVLKAGTPAADKQKQVAEGNKRVLERNAKLERAIRWALGESPPDTPEFPTVDGPPYYRWRTTLRVLSGISPISACEEKDND